MGSNPTPTQGTSPSPSPRPTPRGRRHHSPLKKKKKTTQSRIFFFIPAPLCLPQPSALVFFGPIFCFIIHVKVSLQRERDGVGGDRRGGGGGGQGGGEGIHLIPGSRCIYWRLITEQQSHHALDDFIIWFLGGGGRRGCVAGCGGRRVCGGARSGTKARGRCWRTVEHGAQNKVQWETSVLRPWAQILTWFMGFYL